MWFQRILLCSIICLIFISFIRCDIYSCSLSPLYNVSNTTTVFPNIGVGWLNLTALSLKVDLRMGYSISNVSSIDLFILKQNFTMNLVTGPYFQNYFGTVFDMAPMLENSLYNGEWFLVVSTPEYPIGELGGYLELSMILFCHT